MQMFSSDRAFRMFFFAILLSGCGQSGPAEQSDAAGSVELTVGGTTFPETEGERHWLQFAEQSELKTDGAIAPKMLIYGQLGSEEQIISALRRGRIRLPMCLQWRFQHWSQNRHYCTPPFCLEVRQRRISFSMSI